MFGRWIVAGPPCGGKSTYVQEHAGDGDLVFDYDEAMAAASGRPLHDHDEALRDQVLQVRAAIVDELRRDPGRSGWIITATYRARDLRELRDVAGAEVILLAVDAEEAHRRCDAAGRPAAWHDYIARWFALSDIDPAEFPMPAGKGRGSMSKKVYNAGLTFKSGDAGEFRAVFATFNVVDKDGDLTVPGAFPLGRAVAVEGWNHDYGLPVGRAVIGADGKEAWVDGRFFLDTAGGRETYEVVKGLGPATEWSYTFRILDEGQERRAGKTIRILKALDVVGVAPVTRGAGVGTRTEYVKGTGTQGGAGTLTPAGIQVMVESLETAPPVDTPGDVAAAILELADPGWAKGMMDDDLVDLELADLEQELASSAGRPPHPTNRDAIRAQVVAREGADHSPAWIDAMVEIELAGLADQVARRNGRGGVDPGLIQQAARAAVARWAAAPAR